MLIKNIGKKHWTLRVNQIPKSYQTIEKKTLGTSTTKSPQSQVKLRTVGRISWRA